MRVLALGAHPDDNEILCAGTLARFAQQGATVFMGNIADGSRGGVLGVHEEQQLREVRLEESRQAAAIIGAHHLPPITADLEVVPTQELRDRLIEHMRVAQPDLIITAAENDYAPDHNYTGRLVFDAAVTASLPLYRPAVGHAIARVPIYHMSTVGGVDFTPDEYVDITDTFELKLAMMRCHRSQLTFLDEVRSMNPLEMIRIMGEFWGLQARVRFAEVFRRHRFFYGERTTRLLP